MINVIMFIDVPAQSQSQREVGEEGNRWSVFTFRFDLRAGVMVGYAANQNMMYGWYDRGCGRSENNLFMMVQQALYSALRPNKEFISPRVTSLILVSDSHE